MEGRTDVRTDVHDVMAIKPNFLTSMGYHIFLAMMLRARAPSESAELRYENFHNNNPSIPSHYLKEMIGLILKENSFKFKGENYLQIHGTAMGTKMAVPFANIFMAEIESNLVNQSSIKPIAWKRYIDDVFSLWDTKREDLDIFITQAKQISSNDKIHS